MTLNTALRHPRALLFDQGAIELIRTEANWFGAVVSLALIGIVLAFPVTQEEIITTPESFLRVVGVFLASSILAYLVSRLLGSKTRVRAFLFTASVVNLLGAVVVGVLTYLSLFVFEWWMDNAALSNLVASVLPFYIFLLFGVSVDNSSELNGWKSFVVGAVGICAMYILSYNWI